MSVMEVEQSVIEPQAEKMPSGLDALDEQLLDQLVGQAKERGVKLAGEGGLLQALTRRLLESALEGEITDHLGYEKHDGAGDGSGNSRNGKRTKTVLTDIGPVEIEVPRDRAGTFEPQIVKKRQRRLSGVDEMVLSLSARGLTHGEISAHLAEVYGAEVSKTTISTITDKVIEGMAEWQNRPLDSVFPVIFIDCIHVKIRDGQVANRPIYVALAVTCDGMREILGLWAGDGGEGAKYWMHVLTEIKNRGVADVCMVVCDGLKGLPEAIEAVWPQAITQTCVVHLLRASFRYAARQDWDALAKALRPVYTAATEQAALERFVEFEAAWGRKYPAIIKLWNAAWAEFVPFLNFDVEIRRVVCTTDVIVKQPRSQPRLRRREWRAGVVCRQGAGSATGPSARRRPVRPARRSRVPGVAAPCCCNRSPDRAERSGVRRRPSARACAA